MKGRREGEQRRKERRAFPDFFGVVSCFFLSLQAGRGQLDPLELVGAQLHLQRLGLSPPVKGHLTGQACEEVTGQRTEEAPVGAVTLDLRNLNVFRF